MMKVVMIKDTPVYNAETGEVLNKELWPFDDYDTWYTNRSYLKSNKAAERVVVDVGGPHTTAGLRRLSLSDSFWIKYSSDTLTEFSDITPYSNDFTQSIPELVLGGSQPKVWKKGRNDGTYIRKWEIAEQISAEMFAVKVLRAAGIRTMNTFVIISGNKVFAKDYSADCVADFINLVNMTNVSRALIDFSQLGISIDGYDVNSVIDGYRKAGCTRDVETISVMHVVADAVVQNTDRRHNSSNWGIFMDTATGEKAPSAMYDFNWANLEIIDVEMLRLVADSIARGGYRSTARPIIEKLEKVCTKLGLTSWQDNSSMLRELI